LQNRNYYFQRHLETTGIELQQQRTNSEELILILPKATLAKTNTTNAKTSNKGRNREVGANRDGIYRANTRPLKIEPSNLEIEH